MIKLCADEKMWSLEEKEFEEENKFKIGRVEESCVEDFTIASTNKNTTLGVLHRIL